MKIAMLVVMLLCFVFFADDLSNKNLRRPTARLSFDINKLKWQRVWRNLRQTVKTFSNLLSGALADTKKA
jgi:hypothetical protein